MNATTNTPEAVEVYSLPKGGEITLAQDLLSIEGVELS